jgi:NitT/TauT family transport system substrate-binding protein
VRGWLGPISVLVVSVVVAAGCGGDDNEGPAASPTTNTAAAGTAAIAAKVAAVSHVAGCEHGWTDPDDLAVDRQVARCEKGAPAPQPLPERTTVTLSSAYRLESTSPFLLADSLGELDKENIDLEFVNLPFADAVPQLAQGTLDAAFGGFELALFNGVHQGLPIRTVLGAYFPMGAGDRTQPQTGLWCRRDAFTTPDQPRDAELQSMVWATSIGKGSPAVYYSAAQIRKAVPDFDIATVDIQRIPAADTITALRNAAVDCGVLLDPTWLELVDDPDYYLAAVFATTEPIGGIVYGKTLLEDRPDVGVAFARAIIRTINTYYAGDYHADPAVMAEIARVTNQPDPAALTAVPSLVMDWEIRRDTATRIQAIFIEIGVITDFTTPIPEDRVVDRSFTDRAVGRA